MTSAHTYIYEIDLATMIWGVTRTRTGQKDVQEFLSTDPLTSSYPMLTPYQFASNSPIANIDLDGLEALPADIAIKLDWTGLEVNMSKAPEVFEAANGTKYYTKTKGGRRYNPQYYFAKAYEQSPGHCSKANADNIANGIIPTADMTFIKKIGSKLNSEEIAILKEASMRDLPSRGAPIMEHHHINHGPIARGKPWNVHRGKGN